MRVTMDIRPLLRALSQAQQEIPRAVRNAVNDTAVDAQAAVRTKIIESFSFDTSASKQYFLRAVYFNKKEDGATKEKFRATIKIRDQDNRALVSPFEQGEVKTPFRGRFLAVPGRAILRPGFGGQVKRGTKMADLKPFGQARSLGRFVAGQYQRDKETSTGRPQLVGQRGAFFVTLKKGKLRGMPAILQRSGKGRGKIRLLWLFVPQVKLPPLLTFERTAVSAIQSAWPRRVGQAISFALDRVARKQGNAA